MPAGRPSTFSDQLFDSICLRIAEGESVNQICLDKSMPSKSTFFKWLGEINGLSDRYARAKEVGADAIADEMFRIADDGTNDYIKRLDEKGEDTGSFEFNGEHIQRSRLRIDTRKWYLSKILPKKYGEKLSVGGDSDNPLTVNIVRFGDQPTE
jgi:hypothetical protein